MTEQEMLMFAAKAVGIELRFSKEWHDSGLPVFGPLTQPVRWNPLADDGEALRLAVKLRLTIKVADHEIEVFDEWGTCLVSIGMLSSEDYVASTRFAIVKAVAEIGKEPDK
ncbi:hypothetical protein [Alcaligenes faecalis]|uniref:Phage ABA sandwich domain-containing protein n=1 Tax=Alcaligenes faecalis TaxID=511 RepID=A0AAE9H943_ALCFA|nr:hypothetical protein [Alcaligenes faecalis]UPL20236.1 hypothetical protein MXF72_12450 [Alcaligenes faecalis]